jgi:hypothetical protein
MIRAALAALLLSGCVVAVPDSREDKLSKCAGEARAEYYVGGASVDEAMAVYRRCLRREGVS